jgi:hypothetical protein
MILEIHYRSLSKPNQKSSPIVVSMLTAKRSDPAKFQRTPPLAYPALMASETAASCLNSASSMAFQERWLGWRSWSASDAPSRPCTSRTSRPSAASRGPSVEWNAHAPNNVHTSKNTAMPACELITRSALLATALTEQVHRSFGTKRSRKSGGVACTPRDRRPSTSTQKCTALRSSVVGLLWPLSGGSRGTVLHVVVVSTRGERRAGLCNKLFFCVVIMNFASKSMLNIGGISFF